jgi:hypothetical protein
MRTANLSPGWIRPGLHATAETQPVLLERERLVGTLSFAAIKFCRKSGNHHVIDRALRSFHSFSCCQPLVLAEIREVVGVILDIN